MPCKGICIRHKADSNHYANGHKRCQICQLFIQWDGLFCPCCGSRLRVRPRDPKLNAKLGEKRTIEEAKKIKILLYHLYSL
jgi:hypothetical protein